MRAKKNFSSFSTVRALFFLKITAAFLFSANIFAQNLPDLGDVANSALPLFEEKRLGREIMEELRRDSTFLNDLDATFYLNQLGARLHPNAASRFSFFLMLQPDINAFALPGGFIGVFSGLFLSAQTESELSGVLAHEMAHVTQRHIARRVYQNKQMLIANLLGLGAAALAAAQGNAEAAGAAVTLTQGGIAQKELSFSRDLEREADRIGFETLRNQEFDSKAMASFFGKLLQNKNEKNALVYLQTHPLSSERVSDMENRDAKLPYRQILSSDDFFIIRARLSVLQQHAKDAESLFQNYVNHQRYPHRAAAFYGLAFAQARLNNFKSALSNIEKAFNLLNHPYFYSLKAEILLGLKEKEKALLLLKKAMADFPQHFVLQLHYANALLNAQKFEEAFLFLKNFNQKTPQSLTLRWQAQAALELKKPVFYHAALGESALLDGLFAVAVEHFKKAEEWAAQDFYLAAQMRARLDVAQKMAAENAR